MKQFISILSLIVFLAILPCKIGYAQDIQTIIDRSRLLLDDGKYDEAYKMLHNVDEDQVEVFGDSCIMLYNYEKGASLYYLNQYEKAIPYFKKALLRIEKMPHEDCNYLEIIYGIGSCYNHLQQYENAEKYFRRVFIRGNVQKFRCEIMTQTLNELVELYNKLGYTKLAKECSAKIDVEVNNFPTNSWEKQVNGLFDLAESYEKQGRFDDEIETYHKILNLIESHVGKEDEDYLIYSSILFHRLHSMGRFDEELPIIENYIALGKLGDKDNLYDAYEYYLEIMAMRNEVEIVERLLPDAIECYKQLKNLDSPIYNLYEIIGNSFVQAGNYDSGIKYLEMPWNGELPHNIRALGNLGVCYYRSNPLKALNYYLEAESLINESTDKLTRKIIYVDIMSLFSNLQQYDEALKYAELAAPYIKELDGYDKYATHLISWAIDSENANKDEKALQLYNEVKSLFPSLTDRSKVFYYSMYGFFLLKKEEPAKAAMMLYEGVELCSKQMGDNHAWLITMYHNLGRAYMLQNDIKNALLFLNKSKDLQIKLNGKVEQRTLDFIKECESR